MTMRWLQMPCCGEVYLVRDDQWVETVVVDAIDFLAGRGHHHYVVDRVATTLGR